MADVRLLEAATRATGEFFVSHPALLPGDDADFEKDEIVEYIALTLSECDADAVRDTLAGFLPAFDSRSDEEQTKLATELLQAMREMTDAAKGQIAKDKAAAAHFSTTEACVRRIVSFLGGVALVRVGGVSKLWRKESQQDQLWLAHLAISKPHHHTNPANRCKNRTLKTLII